MTIPKPPATLKAAGRKFWNISQRELEIDEQHVIERFTMACKCLDEIAEYEKTLEAEGRFIRDRFEQIREHPAAKAIRENKVLFCRIIRELGLDLNVGPKTRIPGRY